MTRAQATPDFRMWGSALAGSLLLHVILIGLAVFSISRMEKSPKFPAASPTAKADQQLVIVFETEATLPSAELPLPVESPDRFARTTVDQASAPDERPKFIGERDTRATSDAVADASAPEMPSQSGSRLDERMFETTENDFQDGRMDSPDRPQVPPNVATPAVTPAPVAPPLPPQLAGAEKGIETSLPGTADQAIASQPRDELISGPNPIDVPVPMPTPMLDPAEIRPAELATAGNQGTAEDGDQDSENKKIQEQQVAVPPAPIEDPAFRGNQQKTTIRGSISRTGKSALAVENTALGRYQAQIARAVELEWQRNCVRHRDFITPGFLTVRFRVEGTGKIGELETIGQMETGEIQKGFTLNSIRDAGIPEMPRDLKRELDGESLELIFNFYF